ncbi:MAG: 16S rRNA (cytosine(967)-C(5))-methyltransferase RsmB [Paenibacillaceae bacterium]
MKDKSIINNKNPLSAREVALEILTRVEQDKSYSNLLLNQMLQKHSLERVDAGLVTEIVYGTIQHLNTIDYYLNRFVAKGVQKLEPWVRALLRLSLYQVVYLERIPPHAIVNEAVNLAKKKGHQGISGMINGVMRNVIRQKEQLAIPSDLPFVERIALQYSHPKWMVARWMKQFGEETTVRICEANNTSPKTSARVNTMKHTQAEMLAILQQESVEAKPSELAPNGIIVEQGGNLAYTRWFIDGSITIQDESSMLVAEAVDPQPGMRVLDCCAAPGGKTTHLAEKMQDTGSVIASDIHEHKIALIRDQANRLKLRSIETVFCDALDLSKHYPAESFDCILLDAPCSGLGVIRRKPDLKWSKQELEISAITLVQNQLLNAVHVLLKPGGVLVYSTCTMEYTENQGMIAQFLQQHPQFTLETFPSKQLREIHPKSSTAGMLQILPDQYGSDGFFIARMRKNGSKTNPK